MRAPARSTTMISHRQSFLSSLAACSCGLLADAAMSVDPAAAQSTCYSDWSVARPIIRREDLATVERVSELAEEREVGEIVKTTLCRERGRFVYRLMVRRPSGKVRTMVVDARRPFER
jgi:uncharacterized membrane protein YkoI